MKYKKIKIEYVEAKDRLNRELLVEEDVNLVVLGCIFVNTICGSSEHNFMFRTNSNSYVLENYGDAIGNVLYMSDYKLDDLGNSFEFIYDFGDNWQFTCTVLGEANKRGKQLAYALSGNGAGIFEDGKYYYDEYLEGNFEVEMHDDYEDDEDISYFPYNIPYEMLDRIDEFDVKLANDIFKHCLPIDVYEFIEDAQDMGYEKNVEPFNIKGYLSVEELEDYFGDEDIDDNEKEGYQILHLALMLGIEEQIKKIDYVKEAYERLLDAYSDEHIAKLMIMDVLLGELKDVINGDNPTFSKEYKKKLKRLK